MGQRPKGYVMTAEERDRYRLREQRRREAMDATYIACITILRDPQSDTRDKFSAMRMLDRFNFSGPRGRKFGYRNKPKPKQEPKVPEISREFYEDVLASTDRGWNGHQDEA